MQARVIFFGWVSWGGKLFNQVETWDWTTKLFSANFQHVYFLNVNTRKSRGESIRNLFYSKISTYLVWYINTGKRCCYLIFQCASRWLSFPGSQQYTRKRRHVVEIEMEIEMDLVFPLKPIRKRNISKGWCFSGSCFAWISMGWIRNFSKMESVLDCIWGFVSS